MCFKWTIISIILIGQYCCGATNECEKQRVPKSTFLEDELHNEKLEMFDAKIMNSLLQKLDEKQNASLLKKETKIPENEEDRLALLLQQFLFLQCDYHDFEEIVYGNHNFKRLINTKKFLMKRAKEDWINELADKFSKAWGLDVKIAAERYNHEMSYLHYCIHEWRKFTNVSLIPAECRNLGQKCLLITHNMVKELITNHRPKEN